jgi:hypothetical protein
VTTALETRKAAPTTVSWSNEERHAVLDRAVADLAPQGWTHETKPDYERVLVGHNEFRQLLVRRRAIRNQYELVEVDKHGNISIRRI